MPQPTNYASNNNNEAYQFINAAYAQATGQEPVDTLNLQYIVDAATTWDNVQKADFGAQLSQQWVKTFYTNTSYTVDENDVFFEDAATFGGITRVISMEMPEVIENRSWTAMTSGVSTIGENTVYLPVADEQLFVGSTSWEVPVTFTGTQLNSAFESAAGLHEFNAFVQLAANNSIKKHQQGLSRANRNNYIAEKVNAQNAEGNTRVHVVNLVEEWCKYNGDTSMTAAAFLRNPDALRYSTQIFTEYKKYLQDISILFTTKAQTNGMFVSPDRMVFQMLAKYRGLLENVVYSSTWHEEFVKATGFRDVAAWQGLSTGTSALDFSALSAIDVIPSTGGDAVSVSGIVGLMVDKWAIMHTTVQNRVGVQDDDVKDVHLRAFQFTDRYINNMFLPGVVFVVQDVVA